MPDPAHDGIVFLLRHLGPQTDRDLADSLNVSLAELRKTLNALSSAKRIERHGSTAWRLVPITPARIPTSNPGTP